VLAFLPLLTIAFAVNGTPVKDPKRAVNEQTVDLTPLFQWWNHHEGERPLKAWVHVTGHIVSTTAWGWAVQARLEQTGEKKDGAEKEMKIILKNPPVQEQVEFERLKGQLKTLNDERSHLSAQASTAANHAKDTAHQRHAAAANAAYHHQETAAKDQIKNVDEQLKTINGKLAAFPDHETYSVDCFALQTGQTVNGLPVYDHGVAFR
jgi:hypothetical protein